MSKDKYPSIVLPPTEVILCFGNWGISLVYYPGLGKRNIQSHDLIRPIAREQTFDGLFKRSDGRKPTRYVAPSWISSSHIQQARVE